MKILKKTKATGDNIISHKCNINDKHMMYGSCNMKPNRQFFLILEHFLPFYPSNNQKNQNFQKIKKHLELLSFYIYAP